jgi:uncharacterized protein YbjT (DUF2867 family)
MKIAVIGASGMMGSKIARILERDGFDITRASTSTGVNAYTGEGVERALSGADVVIDVTNTGSFGETDTLDFFRKTSGNLLSAAKASGVTHYLALSVVAVDRLVENDYFRAKLVQENLIRASGLPFTIARSTQMFEFFNGIVDASAVGETLRVPSVRVQPIAADEAAGVITNLATAKPSNSIVEIGGPEAFELVEIAQELLTAAEDPRPVVLDPTARYFGVALSKDGLLPSCIIATGTLSFHEWLFTSMSVQDVA